MDKLTLLGLMLAAILADGAACAKGAPDWLRNAPVFNGCYSQWTDSAIEKMRETPMVIGAPAEREIIEKAHKAGVRALPYVTFYQMPPGKVYQGTDISQHPDWNVIRADGKEGISVFDSSDNPGWKTVCPNSPAYRKYVLEHTGFIMDQGADGLFIDNADLDPICEGPKYGRHKHIYEGKDNIYAYRELLKAVRAEVKKHGDDKIIIANPGEPKLAWVGACDGQMLESYICTWAAENRWHSEARLVEFQKTWGPLVEQGNAIVALSYLGHTKHSKREDAFYCYGWARLSGFAWADWFTGGHEITALFKLRLGAPAGPMQTGDGFYTRRFERGLVMVTSESRGASVSLGAKGCRKAFDVFEARYLKPDDSGEITVTLTAGQGRMYLFD